MAVRNREFPLICIRLDGYPRFPLCSSEFSDGVRAEELSKSSKPQPQSQVKLIEVKSESFLDTGPLCTCVFCGSIESFTYVIHCLTLSTSSVLVKSLTYGVYSPVTK